MCSDESDVGVVPVVLGEVGFDSVLGLAEEEIWVDPRDHVSKQLPSIEQERRVIR